MNMTNKDFETIERALRLLPQDEDFKNLPAEQRDAIIEADKVMMKLARKKREMNAFKAEYVAKKRIDNKGYGRGARQAYVVMIDSQGDRWYMREKIRGGWSQDKTECWKFCTPTARQKVDRLNAEPLNSGVRYEVEEIL